MSAVARGLAKCPRGMRPGRLSVKVVHAQRLERRRCCNGERVVVSEFAERDLGGQKELGSVDAALRCGDARQALGAVVCADVNRAAAALDPLLHRLGRAVAEVRGSQPDDRHLHARGDGDRRARRAGCALADESQHELVREPGRAQTERVGQAHMME